MILMVTDGENKNKNNDELSELLKKYYKQPKEEDLEKFWQGISKKLDSLFHKEVLTDSVFDENGLPLSEESRYWKGLEEYIKNEVNAIKHKTVTDHILTCQECRKNYNDLLNKKKVNSYHVDLLMTV